MVESRCRTWSSSGIFISSGTYVYSKRAASFVQNSVPFQDCLKLNTHFGNLLFLQELTHVSRFVWNTADDQPPRDVPECGFFEELCPAPVTKGTCNSLCSNNVHQINRLNPLWYRASSQMRFREQIYRQRCEMKTSIDRKLP